MIGALFGALCIQRDDFRVKHGRMVREAMLQSGLSVKAAALTMEMDHAQLSRQLDGNGHLSMTRLRLLPSAFWQSFAVLIAVEYGLPKSIRAGQKLRMARAQMRPLHARQEQAS